MSSQVVLDPGHGGTSPAGRSTPHGVGANGTREKDAMLALARVVRIELLRRGYLVALTRDIDRNLSLAERTRVARERRADVFLSLHCDADASATTPQAWIHTRASRASEALAQAVCERIAALAASRCPGVERDAMAVLDPGYHAPVTAACLLELGNLSDPAEASRWRDRAYLGGLAAAIADGVDDWQALRPQSVDAVSDVFDVWHEVPLIEQLTGMSCWAAAAAMVVGWRECLAVDAEDVVRGTGQWEAYRDGLEPGDVETLARIWGLTIEPPRTYTVDALRDLLERYGPLWAGEASPGLHVIVIAGMYGDGTPDNTFVRIADPWPVGCGERYTLSFRALSQNLAAVADLAGVHAQVLHCGGRPGGTRRIVHSHREVHASTALWPDAQVSADRRPRIDRTHDAIAARQRGQHVLGAGGAQTNQRRNPR